MIATKNKLKYEFTKTLFGFSTRGTKLYKDDVDSNVVGINKSEIYLGYIFIPGMLKFKNKTNLYQYTWEFYKDYIGDPDSQYIDGQKGNIYLIISQYTKDGKYLGVFKHEINSFKKSTNNEEDIIANIEDLDQKIIQKHMHIMSIHQKFL